MRSARHDKLYKARWLVEAAMQRWGKASRTIKERGQVMKRGEFRVFQRNRPGMHFFFLWQGGKLVLLLSAPPFKPKMTATRQRWVGKAKKKSRVAFPIPKVVETYTSLMGGGDGNDAATQRHTKESKAAGGR
eukprot:TRINITY_DN807_c0_g2_i13.p1 TRINITY_DN807_c0_g2~~TRINITY_DN807_c0_g2_i13.p1  ORF type:complete len:132 (+),score=14.37 TRINITY_DN807_c0_g2_i13:840-1235(+)